MSSALKRLLLLAVLVAGLALTGAAFAQEATTEPTAAGEETTAAEGIAAPPPAEGATAEEGGGVGEGDTIEAEAEPEAATNPLVPLGINTGFLIAQIINFGLLFLILSLVLWRPLMNLLDSRAVQIQKGLEDAAAAANARRNAETEAEKIIAAARADAARAIEESRARGEELARAVETEARTEADAIRAEARTRATEERDRQLADLRSQVASIAIAVSQRLIGESLDQQRQQALINDFFAKVPADARALNGSVEVVSAMPLTPEEQNRVRQETGASDATFTVDPSILGGLIIRSADRVVDASVRSNLNDLAGRLR